MSKRFTNGLLAPAFGCALLGLTACGGGDESYDHSHGHSHDNGHGHDDGHAHDHIHGHTHDPHASMVAIDAVTVGGYTITGDIDGHMHAGSPAHAHFHLEGDGPGSVVVWIGSEDRTQSVATSVSKDASHYDVELPSEITAETKIWYEVENGETSVKASVVLPGDAHAAHDGEEAHAHDDHAH